ADEVQDQVALLRFLADPTAEIRAAAFLRSRIVRLSDDGVMALAPKLAAAIVGSDAPDALASLSAENRAVLTRLRGAIGRWLALVDRIPTSELLELVLRETAYAYELRGLRRLQARENLKKFRGIVCRAELRGYATLGRIAEHLDRLAI